MPGRQPFTGAHGGRAGAFHEPPAADAAGPAWASVGALARGTDAVGLEALTLLARQVLAPTQTTTTTPPPGAAAEVWLTPGEAARRREAHPLARTPHHLLAVDLRVRGGAAEVDAAVARFGGPAVEAETLATPGAWLWRCRKRS